MNLPDFDEAFDLRDLNRPEPVGRSVNDSLTACSTLIELFSFLMRAEDRVLLSDDEVEGEGSVIM